MIKYYLLYCDETREDAQKIDAELSDIGLVNSVSEADDDNSAILGADFLFAVVSDSSQVNMPEIKSRWELFDNEIRWKRKPYGEIIFFIDDESVLKNLPIRLKKYGYYLYSEVVDAACYCEEVLAESQKSKRIPEAVPRVKQIKYTPAQNTVKQIKYSPARETVAQVKYNPVKDSVSINNTSVPESSAERSEATFAAEYSAPDKKPAASTVVSSTPDKKPAVKTNVPSTPDKKPAVKTNVPSTPDKKPAVKTNAPSAPDKKPDGYGAGKYDYIFEELKRADRESRQKNQQKKSGGCMAAIFIFVFLAIIAFIIYSVIHTGLSGYNILSAVITPEFDASHGYVCAANALQCALNCGIIQFSGFCL